MKRHPGERILQRHLDRDLATARRWAVEAHLAACEPCRDRYAELNQMVREVRELPDSIEPPVDLWPGIAGRIRAPAVKGRQGGKVTGTRRRFRRAAPVVGWIAAVAAVLVLVIGVSRQQLRQPVSLATGPLAAPASAPASNALLASHEQAAYDTAVADLRQILENMRDRLQPETVAVLEENLLIIDAAIAESRAALLADPANDHLHRHLAANMQSKLRFLRMVAGSAAAGI